MDKSADVDNIRQQGQIYFKCNERTLLTLSDRNNCGSVEAVHFPKSLVVDGWIVDDVHLPARLGHVPRGVSKASSSSVHGLLDDLMASVKLDD